MVGDRSKLAPDYNLAAISRTMRIAQDAAQQIQPFTSRHYTFGVPAAYAVAQLLHEDRIREGACPIGRKIGFTNRDMWSRYGVTQPIWAYIYDSTVRVGDRKYICNINKFREPKIEPEIAVHFRSAPPRAGSAPELLQCIDWIAHAFEVVQSHFPGWEFEAPDAIVDSALHASLLVGEPQPLARFGSDLSSALAACEIRLYCDDSFREAGYGSNVLGGPLQAIAHLIHTLANQSHAVGLQADEIVTTGTVTTAHSIQPEQTWRSEVHGIELPGLSVCFKP